MSKQVPLIYYQGAERIVLGMVIVEDDGSLTAQVASDYWPIVKEWLNPKVAEFAIMPVRPNVMRIGYQNLKNKEK